MTDELSNNDQATGAAQAAPDAEVARRLQQAELVVSGTVQSIARAGAARPNFLSTHDPEWWQATVEVQSVEKGKAAGKTVQVLFANSHDVAWFQSPKLKAGDRAVFLLQNRDPFGKPVPGLAVVNALDVEPVSALERVRSLLRNHPGK